jgi:hypothetical protein
MSSRRQNGMNHLLRWCRLVVGSVDPDILYAFGGLRMIMSVSASNP